MDTLGIIFTVILAVALVLVGLYFLGNKLQKKQNESQELIQQNRQVVSAMVIDKKKLKITESGLPKQAIEGVPWYLKIRKLPMAKVKVGPNFMTLLCDTKVFDNLPTKKVVKLEVAGAYIMGFSTAKKGDKIIEKPRKLTFREKIQNRLNGVSNKEAAAGGTKTQKAPTVSKKNMAAAKKMAEDRERVMGPKNNKKRR